MIDPQTRLVAALLARAGGGELIEACSRPWASVTFTGARHRLRLALAEPAADALIDGLEEHEFAIPGHLVADIVTTGRNAATEGVVVEIEALTVEER